MVRLVLSGEKVVFVLLRSDAALHYNALLRYSYISHAQ